MTLFEARKILGLGPDDDPRPFLNEFKEARERIAEMVRTAPNETLALRYQQGLTDFDQALAAVREYLEALGLLPKKVVSIPEPAIEAQPVPTEPAAATSPSATGEPEPPKSEPAPKDPEPAGEKKDPTSPFVFKKAETLPKSAPPVPSPKEKPAPATGKPEPVAAESEAGGEKTESSSPSRRSAKVAWLLTLLLLAIAGGLFYLKTEKDRQDQAKLRIATLEKLGIAFVENRRWPEAIKIYDEIESLNPRSELIAEGRRSIEAGMAEEQSQFVGYWIGQARASLEAKRWDEAAAAAQQVLDRFPKEKESSDILSQITRARAIEADKATLSNARDLLQQRKWDQAIASARKILSSRPDDDEAKTLLQDATAAKEKAAADLARANELLHKAQALDKGQYDPLVIEWIREAIALAPEDPAIKAYQEKIASYARTIRVPGDFATPAEALAQAHDRDRIIVAAGTWDGPLIVNASVDLQGAGSDTTLVQCFAQAGNAITLGPGAKGARITGFSFRHQSFDPGQERYSAALVRGVMADFVDCRFFDASGHGLAVIEGGHALISRCRFTDNGWNGIAASGPGSLLEVRDSESLRNFGHGIESWDGAAVILTGNRCEENSRNGIHADNGGGSVTLEKNQLVGNREFGIVLSSAGSGKASGNTARGNLLGGYAIRATAGSVAFSGNDATKNDGPGLVLDTGLSPASYSGNSSSGNAGQQVMANANLTVRDEVPDPVPANPTTPPRALPILEQ